MQKEIYCSPIVERIELGRPLNLFLSGSPTDLPGSLLGPDTGDDLDDPTNDYKED